MKKILVPIDFSKNSEAALKTAALLAKKNDAKLYPLHMLDVHLASLNESETYIQEKVAFFYKMAEKRIKTFLEKPYLENVEVVPIIKNFKVFSEISDIAKELEIDLIVMGSHGASGLKEFFIGSNTEKVVRYATIPVLVIKEELKNVDFKDVVVATDFSSDSVETFKNVLQTLESFHARAHVVYVNLPSENFKTSFEMEQMANDFYEAVEGNTDRMFETNYVCDRSVEDGILNFANVVGADLITVITNGRKGLSHIFAGSIAEDITNHASLPLLTFKK